jgi:Zn-finger nucleic acid-binding protein
MDCPSCQASLNQELSHGITVYVCPKCNSVWFDRGELEFYKHLTHKSGLSKLDESAEFERRVEFTRECPRCETVTLEMGAINGYEAGQCSACQGLWVSTRKPSSRSVISYDSARAIGDAIAAVVEVLFSTWA